MKIYDFDIDERLLNLELSFNNMDALKNALSDNRSKFRKFAESIMIEFEALESCCKNYENHFMIEAYTYSEQLIKNMYYELLRKNSTGSKYLDTFIETKLPPKRFSPNVKYSELQKSIEADLIDQFKFIIDDNRDEIKSYNELVESRHHYAHKGIAFSSAVDMCQEVIRAEKYITKEVEMIVKEDIRYRLKFQDDTSSIVKDLKRILQQLIKYKENSHPEFAKKIQSSISEYCLFINQYINDYGEYLSDVEMLNGTYTMLKKLQEVDINDMEIIENNLQDLQEVLAEEHIRF